MLIKGFSDFCLATPVFRPPSAMYGAHFRLNTDISELFPYINAHVEGALFSKAANHIVFSWRGFDCSLYPDRVIARFFEDREQALEFIFDFIEYLNELSANRDGIKPNYKRSRRQGVLEIYRVLPRTNCRECGFLTCMAFAAALAKGETVPEQCPKIGEPLDEVAVYPVYDENGSLVSKVEIDINVSKRKLGLARQKKMVETLEKRLASIARPGEDPLLNVDIDGIRVSLTKRELQVLRLLAEGLTNADISRILDISHHTVKTHVINIFNKLGVNDRTHAAVLATRHNLV